MMALESIVTIRESDTPSTKLIAHERELRIKYPQIPPIGVLFANEVPGLTLGQVHHVGLVEAPPPTVDAGELLSPRAHQLLSSAGESRPSSRARRRLDDAISL